MANALADRYPEQSEPASEQLVSGRYRQLFGRPFTGLTSVLVLLAIGIGVIQYGFQQWIPSNLQKLGYDQVDASKILRDSALIGFVVAGDRVADDSTLLHILLIVPIWGISSLTAVTAAYASEIYPTRIRARGTGLAAAGTKFGGVLILAAVAGAVAAPSIAVTALLGAVPLAGAIVLIMLFGIETRGKNLEQITAEELAEPGRRRSGHPIVAGRADG